MILRPFRIIGFTLATAALLLVYGAAKTVARRRAVRVASAWHRLVCKILNVRVELSGRPPMHGRGLIVANHISYLDVPVLGSLAPARFIAKSEVARWPVIGFLARVSGTLFIERDGRKAAEQRDSLRRELLRDRPLALFPEGTSSDGTSVLPFKPALFDSVIGNGEEFAIHVQPMALRYFDTETGEPLSADGVPRVAWFGDDSLVPHLWSLFKAGGVTAKLSAHTPLDPAAFNHRKEMAAVCEDIVRERFLRLREQRIVDSESEEFAPITLPG